MTDKIKLKADKFVNDKKLKLNYIKTKDLKILLAEFCEEQIAELKAECDLAIEGRDIKIGELEKENAELRNNGFTVSAMTEQQLKVALEKGEQLEKENAELKGLVNQYKASKCSGISLVNRNMIMFDQLTKAKDILQRLMENQPTPSSMYAEIDLVGWREVNKEAEQFLKEIK